MIKKFIPILLILLLLSSCTQKENSATLRCKLFYLDSNTASEITSTEAFLSPESSSDAIKLLFNLLAHPENKDFASPIPANVHLIDCYLDNGLCNIVLSDSYSNLPADKLVSLNFALTNTMASIPDTRGVAITSKGKTQIFSTDEFISTVPGTYHDTYTANLYYLKKDFSELVKKTQTVSISPETSLERSVLDLLLSPPEDSDIISPFPHGTVINDVYLDGGTCIVDVSSEFVTSVPHGTDSEEAAVLFAVVNTLTELPKIDSVKFLINASDGYGYIYYNIAEPLTNSQKILDS